MKIMSNILNIPGRKRKRVFDLLGFHVSGSVPSLKELKCVCLGGTNAKDSFCSGLKGVSRSGLWNGSPGLAAFKNPWVCPD